MNLKVLSKRLPLAVLAVGAICATVAAYRLSNLNAFVWLPNYLLDSPSLAGSEDVVDIIFFVPDHWEPDSNPDIVRLWGTVYRRLADKHVDADGVKLQHDFYYPIERFVGREADTLVALCAEGYGDIGIHLHHRDDTSESLTRKMLAGIDSLQAHGALISADGVCRFSFVHGNWALDNSRIENGRNYCGVDNEIEILLGLGCFADATFPALSQLAQPEAVNKLFYAKDTPGPKSYDVDWVRSEVGLVTTPDQLAFMCGTLVVDWEDWRFGSHPTIDDGNLYWEIPTSLHRFEVWLSGNVHVAGRPNWVFVRPFTHGAVLHNGGFANILGENMDRMLTEVEAAYNDGHKYRLHYMTTRQAYNVMKAAEAGMNGNPNDYRNFMVQPYIYQPRLTVAGRADLVEAPTASLY